MSRNRSHLKPGSFIFVCADARLYHAFLSDGVQGEGGGAFVDKEPVRERYELAVVLGTWPATLLMIVGQRPRLSWLWAGDETTKTWAEP